MRTYSGTPVRQDNHLAPSVYDVGVGLGRQPRFAGQTAEWYPVLAHVLTVARLLPGRLAIHGLVHDAAEAIVSDVITPWKTEAAVALEHGLLRRIYRAWDLTWPSQQDWAVVYEIDHEAMIAEGHVLGYSNTKDWPDQPNPLVMEMTAGHLEMCRSMLDPHVSAPIYQEAFDTYVTLAAAA